MKKPWTGYLALGLASYLVFLVATVPAKQAYGLLAPRLAPLALYDVEGTLWSGRAAAAIFRGLRLESVAWDMQLLPLLRGRTQAQLTFRTGDGDGSAQVGRRLDGALYLGEVVTKLPAAQVAPLLPANPVRVGGTLDIKLAELILDSDGVERVRGTVDWKGGTVLAPQPVTLGDFSVTFADTEQGVEAQFRDGGGPLEAKGTLRLTPDGGYELKGALAARNSAPPELNQALQFLGRPGPDGKIPVAYTGRWRATGGQQAPGVVKTTSMKSGPEPGLPKIKQ